MMNIMSTSVTAISFNLIRKAIPLHALKQPTPIKITAPIMSGLRASGRGPGPNELSASSPPEVPTPGPLHAPDVPPEFTRRADGPDQFEPIPLEQPVPGFPVPPSPSPPKPEGPGFPSPSPPEQPEVFPPRGPDVIPPKPSEPGEVVPPRPPMIDPPGGPDIIPPVPSEPGFPNPVKPDIPPPIIM